MRISRDEMFMQIAHVVAKRGTCPRARVGAVLVNNEFNCIVSIGYNGVLSGKPHCEDVGCTMESGHCKHAIHAEMNCLDRSIIMKMGQDFTLYVTHKPCEKCMRQIHLENCVSRVVFDIPYRHNGSDVWEEGGVTFEHFIPDGNRPIQGTSRQDIDTPDDGS